MFQAELRQNLDLFKVNLVAEEWRDSYRDSVNYYLTALIAILAVELGIVLSISLAGYFLNAISFFLVFILIEGPYFLFLLRREGKRYKKKLGKVNDLIKKIEDREPLGDFDTLMKEAEKPKGLFRRVFRFGLNCMVLSAILFGIQIVLLYFQSVINGTSQTYQQSIVKSASNYVDWTVGVFIAVFTGGVLIGALILVVPWEQLEKSARIRRGKKLVGL